MTQMLNSVAVASTTLLLAHLFSCSGISKSPAIDAGIQVGGTLSTGGSRNISGGGVPATGGTTLVDSSEASGGALAGSSSTGDTPSSGGTRGSGGANASGGIAATGGTNAMPADQAIIAAFDLSGTCLSCAKTSCAQYLDGASSCSGLSGTYTALVGDPADGIAVGQSVSAESLCIDVLKCIMPPGAGASTGVSCYNTLSSTATPCYCGTSGTNCSKQGAANGPCAAQEQNGLNTTSASQIPLVFGDESLPAGIANKLSLCLDQTCSCFP